MDVDVTVVLRALLQPSLFVIWGVTFAVLYLIFVASKTETTSAFHIALLFFVAMAALHYVLADDYDSREWRNNWIRLSGTALEKKLQSFLMDVVYYAVFVIAGEKANRTLRKRQETVNEGAS